MELEFWVADNVGEIASFGCTYFFDFRDIKYDIDNKVKKGTITNWLEYTLENQDQYINYHSFIKSNLNK